MDWDFGTVLWTTLVFFFWAATIWMFVAIFADIFHRDMSGWGKAGWVCLIVVLPFLGILIYLIARPREAQAWTPTERPVPRGPSAADEIARANELYEGGKITSSEYQRIKERALA